MTRTEAQQLLTEEYASRIQPLIAQASRAYGSATPGSPPRDASDQYNVLLLEYQTRGGNITQLARSLGVADVTLRRRLRVARSGARLGSVGLSTRGRGDRTPTKVVEAADKIRRAREIGDTDAYRAAVQDAYNSNISLYAVAKELKLTYHSLYAALRSQQV